MKKKIFYVAIIALAMTLSSFSLLKKATFGNLYWFPLDPATGQPQAVSRLVYQQFDPQLCTNWGLGTWCSGGFTSYSGTGPYTAAGMEVLIHYEIIF